MNLMQFWQTKNPAWDEANEGGNGGNPPADPSPASPNPAPAAPDYSWMPDQFRSDDGPDFDGFRAHYDEITAAQAIRDEVLADVPEDGKYEFAVPDDLDFGEIPLPDDFSVNLKTDDPVFEPLFGELGQFMKAHGIPKSAAPDMMKMLAKYEATQFSQFHQREKAARDEMGNAYESRKNEVTRLLETRLPPEAAKEVAILTASANGLRALEKLLSPRGMPAPAPVPRPSKQDDLEAYYNNPSR